MARGVALPNGWAKRWRTSAGGVSRGTARVDERLENGLSPLEGRLVAERGALFTARTERRGLVGSDCAKALPLAATDDPRLGPSAGQGRIRPDRNRKIRRSEVCIVKMPASPG